jgi:branched-chain amino acid transport system substrate-binding protein
MAIKFLTEIDARFWWGATRTALLVVGLGCLSLVIVPSTTLSKVEGDRIIFGATVSLTGKYAINGLHTKNGYNLAVARINRTGGVKVGGRSYSLEIKYYDDKSDPALAARLTERLIRDDKIKFMLGPYSSALTKAEAPVIEKYKIPMIEAGGASRTIFAQGYRYVFSVMSTSERYLSSVVDLVAAMETKVGRSPRELTLAIVVEDDPFSLDVRAGVVARAEALGLEVIADDRFPPNFDDSTDIFRKIKSLKPTILIVSGHSKGAIAGMRHISEMKIDIPVIGMTHCESGELIEKFGTAAEGILCATQWSESLKYRGTVFPSARAFSRVYLKTYKGYHETPYQAAEAAAAVIAWKDAFERANSFDTETLRNMIAMTELRTFYGSIKFAATGQNEAKPMVLRQIQKGKLRVVAPVEWASWPLIYPRKAPK